MTIEDPGIRMTMAVLHATWAQSPSLANGAQGCHGGCVGEDQCGKTAGRNLAVNTGKLVGVLEAFPVLHVLHDWRTGGAEKGNAAEWCELNLAVNTVMLIVFTLQHGCLSGRLCAR